MSRRYSRLEEVPERSLAPPEPPRWTHEPEVFCEECEDDTRGQAVIIVRLAQAAESTFHEKCWDEDKHGRADAEYCAAPGLHGCSQCDGCDSAVESALAARMDR